MFGEEIKRLRTEANLSQVELAALAGMTQAHVSTLESGKRDASALSVELYLKLCDALKVDSDHFRSFMADEPAGAPQTNGKPKGRKRTATGRGKAKRS